MLVLTLPRANAASCLPRAQQIGPTNSIGSRVGQEYKTKPNPQFSNVHLFPSLMLSTRSPRLQPHDHQIHTTEPQRLAVEDAELNPKAVIIAHRKPAVIFTRVYLRRCRSARPPEPQSVRLFPREQGMPLCNYKTAPLEDPSRRAGKAEAVPRCGAME